MRLLAAFLFAIACSKPADPNAPVAFRPADGSFSARAPARWKVNDAPGENRKAAFFGPPDGAKPFSQLMGVYFHPAAEPEKAARAYLRSAVGTEPQPVKAAELSGLEATVSRAVSDIHQGEQRETTRTAVFPVQGGFYSLEHTWPAGGAPDPAFDELLRTFRPAAR
jgi:hypothetical protein